MTIASAAPRGASGTAAIAPIFNLAAIPFLIPSLAILCFIKAPIPTLTKFKGSSIANFKLSETESTASPIVDFS